MTPLGKLLILPLLQLTSGTTGIEHSGANCVLDGLHVHGSWVHQDAIDPLLDYRLRDGEWPMAKGLTSQLCAHGSVAHGSHKWAWAPNHPSCRSLNPLPLPTADRFCRILKGRTLRFVGDSLSANFEMSMRSLVEGKFNRTTAQVAAASHICPNGKKKVPLNIVRRDGAGKAILNGFKSRYITDNPGSIVVIGEGAHYRGSAACYEDVVAEWVEEFRTVRTQATYIFWSTTPGFSFFNHTKHEKNGGEGHKDISKAPTLCKGSTTEDVREPLPFFPPQPPHRNVDCYRPPDQNIPLQVPAPQSYNFNWHTIPSYNKAARRAFKDIPNVHFLDLAPLSVLRPDSHPYSFTEGQEAAKILRGAGEADCLHWCLPGVPDTWSALLLELIDEISAAKAAAAAAGSTSTSTSTNTSMSSRAEAGAVEPESS